MVSDRPLMYSITNEFDSECAGISKAYRDWTPKGGRIGIELKMWGPWFAMSKGDFGYIFDEATAIGAEIFKVESTWFPINDLIYIDDYGVINSEKKAGDPNRFTYYAIIVDYMNRDEG